MSPNSDKKYKTYKSDAAPFLFYIDVLPLDLSHYEIPHHVELLKNVQFNPIMPLPLRVDRVFNGESSVLIRPMNPISFSLGEDYTAIINPTRFIQFGIEKLLNFTEIRSSEEFAISLSVENAKKWWENSRYLHGRLRGLEEDFAAFLRAYLYIVLKAKINNEELIRAAIKYCELIRDICNKRIQEKLILVETKGKEKIVNLYKMKEGRSRKKLKFTKEKLLYPTFVDIEVINLKALGFSPLKEGQNGNLKKSSKVIKYIPLLIYDDLLECMLQNLEKLEQGESEILDPSFLLEQKIILLMEKKDWSPDRISKYTWLEEFNQINIDSILESIEPTFEKLF
jgi:hypothetical protein